MTPEEKMAILEARLELRSKIMLELMDATEYYQKRSHEVEKISLELLACPWWKIVKIIKLEKRIHLAILSHMEDLSIDKTFANLKELVVNNLEDLNS
jgi:hypothetical protein